LRIFFSLSPTFNHAVSVKQKNAFVGRGHGCVGWFARPGASIAVWWIDGLMRLMDWWIDGFGDWWVGGLMVADKPLKGFEWLGKRSTPP
jgi:hypothetical protein